LQGAVTATIRTSAGCAISPICAQKSAFTPRGGRCRACQGENRDAQIKIMEQRRKLVRREDVDELVDAMAGTLLTHLSGLGARCSRDLVVRRNIDSVVLQIRREIAEACSKMADERGEPPLEEQS